MSRQMWKCKSEWDSRFFLNLCCLQSPSPTLQLRLKAGVEWAWILNLRSWILNLWSWMGFDSRICKFLFFSCPTTPPPSLELIGLKSQLFFLFLPLPPSWSWMSLDPLYHPIPIIQYTFGCPSIFLLRERLFGGGGGWGGGNSFGEIGPKSPYFEGKNSWICHFENI